MPDSLVISHRPLSPLANRTRGGRARSTTPAPPIKVSSDHEAPTAATVLPQQQLLVRVCTKPKMLNRVTKLSMPDGVNLRRMKRERVRYGKNVHSQRGEGGKGKENLSDSDESTKVAVKGGEWTRVH